MNNYGQYPVYVPLSLIELDNSIVKKLSEHFDEQYIQNHYTIRNRYDTIGNLDDKRFDRVVKGLEQKKVLPNVDLVIHESGGGFRWMPKFRRNAGDKPVAIPKVTTYSIVNGRHRVAASIVNGETYIAANISKTKPPM